MKKLIIAAVGSIGLLYSCSKNPVSNSSQSDCETKGYAWIKFINTGDTIRIAYQLYFSGTTNARIEICKVKPHSDTTVKYKAGTKTIEFGTFSSYPLGTCSNQVIEW